MTNPSAKQRFLKDSRIVGIHQEMVNGPAFQYSADTALLQYQEQLQFGTPNNDLNLAAGNYLRLLGAREFLFVLRNLGEQETRLPKLEIPINLETRKS